MSVRHGHRGVRSVNGLAIRSPWTPLTGEAAGRLEAAAGVYELRRHGTVEVIDYAGTNTAFGLRGELARHAGECASGTEFRVEVTSAYISRWSELLSAYLNTFGQLPRGNAEHRPHQLRPFGHYGADHD